MTGLAAFANHRPRCSPAGMRQRAALCPGPARRSARMLLLLDEPFGALDALTREELSLELSASGRIRAHRLPHHARHRGGDPAERRVLVMSPRPGRIRRRHRDRPAAPAQCRHAGAAARFQELKQQIRDIIFDRRGLSDVRLFLLALRRPRDHPCRSTWCCWSPWEVSVRVFAIPAWILPAPTEIGRNGAEMGPPNSASTFS